MTVLEVHSVIVCFRAEELLIIVKLGLAGVVMAL